MKWTLLCVISMLVVGCAGPGSRPMPAVFSEAQLARQTEDPSGTTSADAHYAFFHVGNVIRAMDQRTNRLAFEIPVGTTDSSIRDFQIDRAHRMLYALLVSSTYAPSFVTVDIRRRIAVSQTQLPRSSNYSYPVQLAVGERGKYLYYLEWNGQFEPGIIRQISTESNAITQSCKTGHNASAIAADSTRPLLYASWYFSVNGAIGVLNTNECRFLDVVPVEAPDSNVNYFDPRGGNNSGLRLNRAGTRLYMISDSGWPINQAGNQYFNRVFVFNTAQRAFIAKPWVYGGPYDSGLAVSPDGASVVSTDCLYPYTNLINAATNSDASLIPGNGGQLGFNQSGSRLYEVSDRLRVLDFSSKDVIATLPSYGDAPGDFSE